MNTFLTKPKIGGAHQTEQAHLLSLPRFFNIIPGDGCCCLLLYGEIGGEVRSGDVMRELLEAERMYGRIDVRINSVGGEIYSGIAIFNALRQSKADIHIYIDGIAASMASVIALCGKPVEMSKYARLMIHTVRGGCWGTKKDMSDCIEQLDALEGTLCAMYAEKLGKSEAEIRSEYFDGEDHWLSAQEALEQGFVDGIYDVDAAVEPLPTEEMTADEIYRTFNNRLEMGVAVSRQHTVQPQNPKKMVLLDELKKNPKFKDCASEEAALQIVAQLEKTAGSADVLAAENATLKQRLKVFEDKEAAAFMAEKQQLLDAAEKCGKINAVTRPAFAALLESDFEKGKKLLEDLQPTKRVIADLQTPAQESAWDKRKSQIQDRYEQTRS